MKAYVYWGHDIIGPHDEFPDDDAIEGGNLLGAIIMVEWEDDE